MTCNNVTVQNNDIGPCGSDAFQEWADGISISCRNSVVKNNMIQGPTDGGIVLFGAPGTQVFNNTIWILNVCIVETLFSNLMISTHVPSARSWVVSTWWTTSLGMVILPALWYTIIPFWEALQPTCLQQVPKAPTGHTPSPSEWFLNDQRSYKFIWLRIGIAVGPRTWFGDRYGYNVSRNGIVRNNRLSGAFSYGIAVASADNFTVESNVMFDNTSFIGARGPYCKDTDIVPADAPFIVDWRTVKSAYLQSDFQSIDDGESLTCVLPPDGGNFWPLGRNPSNSTEPSESSVPLVLPSSKNLVSNHDTGHSSHVFSITVGVFFFLASVVAACFIRRWMLSRKARVELSDATIQGQQKSRRSIPSGYSPLNRTPDSFRF